MIGKISIGKFFAGCIQYCLHDKVQKPNMEPVMEDRAEVLMYNQCYGNEKELVQQFNEVRQLNPNLSKPVMHITLSLAPGENLHKEKLMNLCEECAKDMGFEKNQYIAIRHLDTNHLHLHLIINRVGYDKRTVSDSQNFKKMAAYCRKMELKFELKQVLSPRQFLSQEERLIPRQDIRKEQLRTEIQQTLEQVKNYPQFQQKMESLGYQVFKARGISFTDSKKVKIKGSEVGYPLAKIEKILAAKQELTITTDKQEIKQEIKQTIPQKQHHHFYKNEINKGTGLLKKRQEDTPDVETHSHETAHQKQQDSLVYLLMKSEKTEEKINPELVRKKKKQFKLHL